jgi:hypothetical protein
MRIAAALKLAGFDRKVLYPSVTDACGKLWPDPCELLIATALAGGESSGNAWAFRVNYPGSAQQSTDFGCWEINNMYNQQWFGPIGGPEQLNWAILYDNADMAYQVWHGTMLERVKQGGLPSADWAPWHAYSGGGYLEERWLGKSWMHWAQWGIDQMNGLEKRGLALDYVASVDLDPLVYWEGNSE